MPTRREFLARSLAAAALLAAPAGRAQPAEPRMQSGRASSTARSAAVIRALHQLIDGPPVLADPFAVPIVAPLSPAELRAALDTSTSLRASIVLRSRYAEDRLAEAVARGVRQYVLLGAGLDTFALRNPHAGRALRVYEVDHPATQQAKRDALKAAALVPKRGTVFVPVDFETQSLAQQLARAGFRRDRPAFFSMLGVVIYLTDAAVMETMEMVAKCARGSEVVFSFSVPSEQIGAAQRAARERSMKRMEAIGEPWLTFYDPDALAARLRGIGFAHTDLLGPEEANRRYFAGRTDGLRMTLGHMMAARV